MVQKAGTYRGGVVITNKYNLCVGVERQIDMPNDFNAQGDRYLHAKYIPMQLCMGI